MNARKIVQLSIVVPCFNEEEVLPEFHRRIVASCQAAGLESYEILYVNDGSRDNSLKVMNDLQSRDSHVGIIDLSRNFGHQPAASAGLAQSVGDLVLLIDADLQDPPELVPEMIARIGEGADVVYAQRNMRKGEGVFKRATASLFYRLLGSIGSTNIPADTGDFRLMTRRVVDVLVRMPESHRFIRGLVAWIGFTQVPIGYDRHPRLAGQTKYPFMKMLAFSFDAITSFAIAPLRIMFGIAVIAMGLAAIMMGWTIYSFLVLDAAPGWSSIMSVFLFFTAVQLFALAVIGEYVGRNFIESKQRPLYVIRTVVPPRLFASPSEEGT